MDRIINNNNEQLAQLRN